MPFRDPQSSDEQIFGISPAGDLFEVFRSSATFATAPYDLSAAIGTVPRLVGNPAPFVDPQSGAEQIFARAVNGDLIVVARGLHDGGLVWYDLSGPGTPPLASDPVPFRDPQSGQEQVFATSTGGSLFEVFRDSLTFAVYPYGLSLGASVRGAPAPFVDPQIGSEQIVVSGTNGDVFDFARALSGGGVGLFDLTRQTPGAPTLGGDPVPFRDPQSGQEQIFGVSTGGHLFEVYRDTATFVTSAFDLSGTTSPLSGRPSPFRDPQTGMEQIFVRVANSDLERFDRSPSFGLALTDLTVQSANGQTTAGNPHPFADPQVNTEQVIAASSVVQVSDMRAGVARVARGQVGRHDTPASTSFGFDCNPYTAILYNGYSAAGCGTDPYFGVQDLNLEWCADFSKWVWEQAGVSQYQSTLTPAAASFYRWGQQTGQTMAVDASTPQVGDAIVFFPAGAVSGTYADHVGIVTGVNTNGTVDIANGDFLSGSNIVVEENAGVSPAPFASAIWGAGEQWVYVSP